jgi:hypothetical protein
MYSPMRIEGPKVAAIERPLTGRQIFLAVLNGLSHEMSIKNFSASNSNN